MCFTLRTGTNFATQPHYRIDAVILALDIDDTITAEPGLFAALSHAEGVRKVVIISTRSDLLEARVDTEAELDALGIRHHVLHLLPGQEEAVAYCPHKDLTDYQKYLWQKVALCQREGVDVVFEDDVKVIDLFKRFAPEIRVLQVHRKARDHSSAG